MKKMVDVIINIDSLFLECDEDVDDVITHLRERFDFGYEPTWEIIYEEPIDD
jgi:hypothetical protein